MKESAELLAPPEPLDVEEERARRVRRIRRVDSSSGELPYQPGVDGTREQSSVARHERDLRPLEEPLELCRREVGIGTQSSPFGDHRRFASQLRASLCRAPI